MAVHTLTTNRAAHKIGRVVADSGSVHKTLPRLRRRTSNRSETAGRRPTARHQPAPANRRTNRPRTNAAKLKKAATKIRKKTTGSMRAVVITLTLSIPVAAQIILAAILSYSVSFTTTGLIAWATQNFSIIEASGQIVFASLWTILLFLNLIMFIYVIGAYTISLVNVFTPGALVILGVCVAAAMFPPFNIIPWVLVYVWAIALTR